MGVAQSRFKPLLRLFDSAAVSNTKEGMVRIQGGTFSMGADNNLGLDDEYPKHTLTVKDFWMDATEVTNAQFAQYVRATGYITTAERKPDWESVHKSLPPVPPGAIRKGLRPVFWAKKTCRQYT
jgi:formylglycine-generating enzyme required for sulfatase activity